MKTLKVEKNKVFIRYELSDRSCSDILSNSQSGLRFDLTYMDDDEDLKKWRASISMGEAQFPILEIKDYNDNKRTEYALSDQDTMLDASTIAMRQVWNQIENEAAG